ncbi:hypothetical protein J3R82DRAFT_4240 [Butyriboletus roseoflavus]|nr:hypothetical protein J3R82DRAFT_4240 [Butyriboletus roseoflavus]
MDDADPIPREPRPVRKQRRIVSDVYQEDDEDIEDLRQDVAMKSPPPEIDGGSSGDPNADAVAWDANDQPPHTADIELLVEEDEKKPKPLLKLKYRSFPISGHCLCVVVEPWPPLRAKTRLQSVGLGTSFQAEERAKTPLFFPEHDRAPSEARSARDRILPPVPLFHDAILRTEEDSDNDLMNFSQTLNAAGHMHTVTADDDDDMDGAVLFGDADEVRELL